MGNDLQHPHVTRSQSTIGSFTSLPAASASASAGSRPPRRPPPPPTTPKPALPPAAMRSSTSSNFLSQHSGPVGTTTTTVALSKQQSASGAPLRFHKKLFGKSVTLTKDFTVASRDPNGWVPFCCARAAACVRITILYRTVFSRALQ